MLGVFVGAHSVRSVGRTRHVSLAIEASHARIVRDARHGGGPGLPRFAHHGQALRLQRGKVRALAFVPGAGVAAAPPDVPETPSPMDLR